MAATGPGSDAHTAVVRLDTSSMTGLPAAPPAYASRQTGQGDLADGAAPAFPRLPPLPGGNVGPGSSLALAAHHLPQLQQLRAEESNAQVAAPPAAEPNTSAAASAKFLVTGPVLPGEAPVDVVDAGHMLWSPPHSVVAADLPAVAARALPLQRQEGFEVPHNSINPAKHR